MGKSGGFSVVELLVVLAIFGVFASFAIPQYLIYIETAQATACLVERGQTNRMIIAYMSDHQDTAFNSLAQLVGDGYVEEVPNCPHGGQWVLVPSSDNNGTPVVGCSIHFWPEDDVVSEPLTSLGSTFDEITKAMIALINGYYEDSGRYPRSWGSKAFTDIGLDPEEWGEAVEGLEYTPRGKRLGVSPADGYTINVTLTNGQEMELPASRNWSIWYSMEDGNWYYKNINDKNQVDISTLTVTAD